MKRTEFFPALLPGKSNLFFIRLGLFTAVTGILHIGSKEPVPVTIGFSVLAFFLISHLGLALFPAHSLQKTPWRISIILADTFLLALALNLSGVGSPPLYLYFFSMILIIALLENLPRILAAAGTLTLVYFFGSIGWQSTAGILERIPHPVLIPFFGMAALYYGYFVADVRRREAWAHQAHRERQELRTLLDILEATNSTLDFQAVMHRISVRMAELLQSSRVSIVLVDPVHRNCSVLASSDDRGVNRLPIQLEKYPEIRKALETRAPVIIHDIEQSALLKGFREQLLRLGFRSLLVIPLRYGDEIFGTICLRASRQAGGFAPDEVRFAQIVASAAANAVKNSLLYRQVQEESLQHKTKAQQLRHLFDHLPDLIFLADPTGRIVDINRSASRVTGYTRDEILDRDLTVIWPSADSVSRLQDNLKNGRPWDAGEVQLRQKNGKPVTAHLTLSPLGNPGGKLQGIIAIAQDLSEQKRTEMQIQHAERLSSVGELVATVAHELRNRLTGVLGFSQLLSLKNRDPALTRDLDRISHSAENCRKIVQDLLSFSRKSEPDPKVLGINAILRKTLELEERQLEEFGIRVELDLDPQLPRCHLDFQQIQQVFLNLIANARQAISAHGSGGTIRISTRPEEKQVVVEIQDSGPGMDRETRTQIFDPFFTTKQSEVGTGLGLSISYGIIRNHQGQIEVESEPGKGSLFRIRLPITHASDDAAPMEAASIPARGRAILVVDDDPTILELYMEIRRGMGHQVDTAAIGLEAYRKVQEKSYDLIISDLKMPKMDGLELLERIMKLKPDISSRIVVTTGDLNYLRKNRDLNLSEIPCLLKPLNVMEVEQVVERVLA